MYKEIIYPYMEGEREGLAVSLEEIKRYLKLPCDIEDESLDAELTLMCETATDYAEKYTRQIFVQKTITTNRVFWGEFRNGILQNSFTLRRTPCISITSVKFDEDYTLDASNYKLINRIGNFDKIAIIGNDLPEIRNDWFPIEIKYQAGYNKVPNDIKQAILMHIASMWLNRGDYDNNNLKCPQMAKDIYKKYKIIEIGS